LQVGGGDDIRWGGPEGPPRIGILEASLDAGRVFDTPNKTLKSGMLQKIQVNDLPVQAMGGILGIGDELSCR